MKEGIYQHYRKEEQAFIDYVLEQMAYAASRYCPVTSYFVTPREALIAQQLANGQDEVQLACQGGLPGAERQRLVFYPQYYDLETSDFQIQALKIHFPQKFANIRHGSILGSLLGAGLERNRIGDIITDGQDCQVLVDAKIAPYVCQNVTKMGNVGVRLENIEPEQVLTPQVLWEDQTVITTSLRLDTMLSKVYNFSRQRAKEAVLGGLVKVNYLEINRPDFELEAGDFVSLRKFGRFQIDAEEGLTRKDNIRLKVKVLVV